MRRLPDIPGLDHSPSPEWTFDDNPADVVPADPKGKKRRIEEVVDEPSKTKPRKKAAAGKPAAKKPKKVVVKQEVKKEVKSGSSNGRKPGAAGYSEKEIMKLLQLIQKYLPIGGAGWDLVMVQYNRWAKKNEFSCDRARKALRTKFDAVYNVYTICRRVNADTRPDRLFVQQNQLAMLRSLSTYSLHGKLTSKFNRRQGPSPLMTLHWTKLTPPKRKLSKSQMMPIPAAKRTPLSLSPRLCPSLRPIVLPTLSLSQQVNGLARRQRHCLQ
jgi:hypothetical protein